MVAKLKDIVHARLKAKDEQHTKAAKEAMEMGKPPPKHKPVSFSRAAIARSAFSHVMFELEDRVLDAIDESFRNQGWTVASLIFDGMLVEHREGDTQDASTGCWLQLEDALRTAETAVLDKLGYRISLLEKPLYDGQAHEEAHRHKRARHAEPGPSGGA